MKIDESTIKKLAGLSKLEFSEEEMKLITEDMTKMVDFINKLEEVNTENISPLIHVNEEYNNWREDEVAEMLSQKAALLNSPQKDSTYFKLPKVLDK